MPRGLTFERRLDSDPPVDVHSTIVVADVAVAAVVARVLDTKRRFAAPGESGEALRRHCRCEEEGLAAKTLWIVVTKPM